ncbi:MAG: MFS transporter [Bacilli bacterium]
MRRFIWMACAMYFSDGLATIILGAVLPPLLAHYHLPYATGGQLVFFQFIGFLLGVPTASYATRRVGYRTSLVAASLCTGLALSGIALLPAIPFVALLCLLSGLGIAASETAVATLVMEAFVGRRAVVMSYLEVAFGLGALVMPAVSSLLIAHQAWPLSFVFAGALSIGTALGWLLTSVVNVVQPEEHSARPRDALKPLDAPGNAPQSAHARGKSVLLALYLLMIFLYVGTESSLSSFLPSLFIVYLHELSYAASLSVATFWSAMVLGRIATGWIVRKVAYAPFLLASVAGTVAMLLALTLSRNAIVCYAIVFVLGLFMSGIYSVTMVFANTSVLGSARLVTGLITAFAGIGGAVLPALVGFAMDHAQAVRVIGLIGGFAVLLLITLAVILLVGLSNRKRSAAAFD